FNEDIEHDVPAVDDLRQRVAAADGILIATPEYNWSIPGVLKNAIDWLSRPPMEVLARKRIAIIGATGGTWGTRLSQAPLREVGTVVHTMAAALGFSALLSTSPVAFSVVKFAGVIYLAIVGVRTMFSPAPAVGQAEARPYTAFRRAFITNVLNPKVAVFFLAFLPQFVR